MAKLTLSILGRTNEPDVGIDAVVKRVKNELQSLEKTPVKIQVDTKELDAATQKLREAGQALGGSSSGSKNGAAAQMQELGTAAQKTSDQIKQLTSGTERLTEVYRYAADGSKTLVKTIQDENTNLGNTISPDYIVEEAEAYATALVQKLKEKEE